MVILTTFSFLRHFIDNDSHFKKFWYNLNSEDHFNFVQIIDKPNHVQSDQNYFHAFLCHRIVDLASIL